eukprot:6199195-Amphidinium_carterae.1
MMRESREATWTTAPQMMSKPPDGPCFPVMRLDATFCPVEAAEGAELLLAPAGVLHHHTKFHNESHHLIESQLPISHLPDTACLMLTLLGEIAWSRIHLQVGSNEKVWSRATLNTTIRPQ